MRSLTVTQMETTCAGDFWHDAAVVGCAAWGFGRFFCGIAISVVGSPLTGAILTKIVDGCCVLLAVHDAVDMVVS